MATDEEKARWRTDPDAAYAEAERRIEAGRLVSDADPAIELAVPAEAVYLGARRLEIDETFDAELHVFAEVDAHDLIERFYWIQFESHLPGAPGRYDDRESNPETILLDGVEIADPQVVTKSWPGYWEALDAIPSRLT